MSDDIRDYDDGPCSDADSWPPRDPYADPDCPSCRGYGDVEGGYPGERLCCECVVPEDVHVNVLCTDCGHVLSASFEGEERMHAREATTDGRGVPSREVVCGQCGRTSTLVAPADVPPWKRAEEDDEDERD
jgi:hypothetical protein